MRAFVLVALLSLTVLYLYAITQCCYDGRLHSDYKGLPQVKDDMDNKDNLREVGVPSRNILHVRVWGWKSRIGVTRSDGS